MDEQATQDAQERLIREFRLTENQALFVIMVGSGMKPIDAVHECYDYKHENNYYNQLKALVGNDKIDTALKSLGLNLRDMYDKHAYAIVNALQDIAFDKKTSTRDRLSALKELAAYNPMLQKMKSEDADDREETDIEKRLRDHLSEG